MMNNIAHASRLMLALACSSAMCRAQSLPSRKTSCGYEITSVAFSPDGRTVAAGGKFTTMSSGPGIRVQMRNATSLRLQRSLKAHYPDGFAEIVLDHVAFVRGGRQLLAFDRGAGALTWRWDIASGKSLGPLAWSSVDATTTMASSRDGAVLAVGVTPSGAWKGPGAGAISIYDARKGRWRRARARFDAQLHSIAVSPDGRRIAALAEGRVKIVDARTGRTRRVLPDLQNGGASRMAFVTSRMVAVMSDVAPGPEIPIRLWDVRSGRLVRTLFSSRSANAMVASPDGRLLAGCSNDGRVLVWNTVTGQRVRVLNGQTNALECLAFSPDSRLLASGGNDGILMLWRLR